MTNQIQQQSESQKVLHPEILENLEIPNVDSYTQEYISEKDLSLERRKQISECLEIKQEQTRANIVRTLLVCFGASLATAYLLIGFASISPKSDKAFIREMIPIIISPQATLIGVAFGFYFRSKT